MPWNQEQGREDNEMKEGEMAGACIIMGRIKFIK
jgi:hypothetical protein